MPSSARYSDGSELPTRERLLDAAERLFAAEGFKRASIREITAAAGCNLAAVNYHFGGKAALYREVFRRRIGIMRGQRLAALEKAAAAQAAPDLEAMLRAFADVFLAPLHDEPAGRVGLRLIAQEMVDPQLPGDFFRDELVIPVNRALTAAVSSAAPELPERTVHLCVQSFVGQLLHVVHAQQFSAVKAKGPLHQFAIPELSAHIVRFSVAAIERLREESAMERRSGGGAREGGA